MKMWDRFSEPAKRVVLFAQEDAWRMGWEEILPIHFFGAIFRDEESHAAKSLKMSGIPWDKFREILRDNLPRRDIGDIQRINIEEMKLNPESVFLIENSYRKINYWKKLQINTVHILLRLLDIGIMNQYGLCDLDFNEEIVRQEAQRLKDKPEADLLREKEGR